jgi:GNAT superfamily N-acetyltransferase
MIVELLPPDTGRAYDAMRALRPHVGDRDAFVSRVDDLQRPQGYRLVAAFPETDAAGPSDEAAGVAGFRTGVNLAWGHYLYVDDLSTLPEARGQGHAGRLLAWLHEEARRLGCDEVHLDSGVGEHRLAAHRLYFNHGYRIASHHFSREVEE